MSIFQTALFLIATLSFGGAVGFCMGVGMMKDYYDYGSDNNEDDE